jgi:tetratricopeptide (TPR) repeat protein
VLADGFEQKPGADSNLVKLITNNLYPEIVRATALQYLSGYGGETTAKTVREMLTDPEPIVRETAVNTFNPPDQADYIVNLAAALNDPTKMVRITAANRLSGIPKENFTAAQLQSLTTVLKEYLSTLEYSADFPTGKYNLGNYYANQGDIAKAAKFYTDAIREDSLLYQAKSNLALLYYGQGKIKEAENLFLDLIKNHSNYDQGEYYLGLLYAEQNRFAEAAEILEKGTQRANVNPRIYYNLGLIYQQLNEPKKAESTLLRAYTAAPDNFDLLYALTDFYVKSGNKASALKYAREMDTKFPSSPTGKQIIDFIQNQMPN